MQMQIHLYVYTYEPGKNPFTCFEGIGLPFAPRVFLQVATKKQTKDYHRNRSCYRVIKNHYFALSFHFKRKICKSNKMKNNNYISMLASKHNFSRSFRMELNSIMWMEQQQQQQKDGNGSFCAILPLCLVPTLFFTSKIHMITHSSILITCSAEDDLAIWICIVASRQLFAFCKRRLALETPCFRT